jgi:hypothetical protein
MRRLLLTLLCLLGPAQAASWTRFTPDAPPLQVQAAYPGQLVVLTQALQVSGPPDAETRALVDALVTAWVGPGAQWWVPSAGSGSALVSRAGGRQALLLQRSGGARTVLAFELTLQSALQPGTGFAPVPDATAFWTGRLPAPPAQFSDAPCPQGIRLDDNGVTVTTPANFPLPGGRALVQSLHCQNLEITVRGGGTYQSAEQITVRAPTWQQAWAVVAPSPLVFLLIPGP